MSHPTTMLPAMLLIVLLTGCAAPGPRCDTRLRPINVAVSAAAPANHRRSTHE